MLALWPRNRLGWFQNDVGQALGVQRQHFEFEGFIDERCHPAAELGCESAECQQHANRQRAIQHLARAQPE
ncbi:hypothetical protein D3C86_2238750 [compost metagenome]